jgi:integrase/recombinase XerD
MRKILFPTAYLSDFSQSPVADVLTDFEGWLRATGYHRLYLRRPLGYVRRVLERQPSVPVDRRFDRNELTKMFRSSVRPSSFRAAGWAFEQYLRDRKRLIEVTPQGPFEDLLRDWSAHLRDMRGLAPSTIVYKMHFVRSFLAYTCPTATSLAALTPHDIERFVARRSRALGRGALISVISAIRAFLRYCEQRGLCGVGLDQIDTPTRYRQERQPRAIPWILTQRLLASIDRSTRLGCRDHAVFHLMAHYGLRTGDTCALRLDDVDLKRRVLRVPIPKVHSTLPLPLSKHTCGILADYLQRGRPRSSLPYLFLKAEAPIGPLTRGAVSETFRRRVQASGLPLLHGSPYGLRHGFAMRLLERGVGIKAIGDVMGHRSIESTAVYLRLDVDMLREVALPVPTTSTERRAS